MKEMTFEEFKRVELDILLDVAKFCDDNSIAYFLGYGTLIGAVRHKGFIPWDDDIDIYMPRDDYNKFIELFVGDAKPERLEAIHPHHPKSRQPFMKIIDNHTVKIEKGIDFSAGYLGVDIDVFPVDGQPEDSKEFEKWFKKLDRLYTLYFLSVIDKGTTLKRRLAYSAMKVVKIFMPIKKILKKTEALHAKYPFATSKYVGSIESACNVRGDRARRECFEGYEWCDFEGYKFKMPKGYHEIMTNLYGDYMQLPPEEARVTHHFVDSYWKDDSENKKEA
ncbi:MAG: LicD family protein [Clostridia bacterium]|nr:LicD family protein [Clostridia bacterium]